MEQVGRLSRGLSSFISLAALVMIGQAAWLVTVGPPPENRLFADAPAFFPLTLALFALASAILVKRFFPGGNTCRTFIASYRLLPRLGLVLILLIWSGSAFWVGGTVSDLLGPDHSLAIAAFSPAAAVFCLTAYTIFPAGIGYAGLAEEVRARRNRKRAEKIYKTEVTYHARTDDTRRRSDDVYRPGAFAAMEMPVTYRTQGGPATVTASDISTVRAQHAAMDNDFVGRVNARRGKGPARSSHNASTSAKDGNGFIANLIIFVFFAPMILGFVAFRFAPSVPDPAFARWLDEQAILGCLIAGGIVLVPILLNPLRGRPLIPERSAFTRSAFGKLSVLALCAAMFGPTSYFFGAYDAFPYAWNAVTDNPRETMLFQVDDVSTSRRSRGCLELMPLEAPGRTLSVCQVGRFWPEGLTEGEIIAVAGERSAFGMTIDAVARN